MGSDRILVIGVGRLPRDVRNRPRCVESWVLEHRVLLASGVVKGDEVLSNLIKGKLTAVMQVPAQGLLYLFVYCWQTSLYDSEYLLV